MTTSNTSAANSISDIVDVIKQNISIKHHEDFLLSLCLSEQFQLGETEADTQREKVTFNLEIRSWKSPTKLLRVSGKG